MCKFYLLIFFIIIANCSCISFKVEKVIQDSYSTNKDILKHVKRIEHTLDELQNNLIERIEQIDQKFASISKLQTSIDELGASVAKNMKNVNDWHNQSTSKLKMFKSNLDEMQNNLKERIEQINQTIVPISEKQQLFGHQIIETKSLFQKEAQNLAYDCSELYNVGLDVSKSYFLPKQNRTVLCDMETDGGGWLLIQQRRKMTNQVNFNRTWASYKEGFGDLDTEFWIGNEFLHRITNQKSYELRIDMEDFENRNFYAIYSKFRVGNEESGYQLHVNESKGNASDNLENHNNEKFTTFDRDNDKDGTTNCAKKYSGGFWYWAYCTAAHLNGVFPTDPDRENDKLIHWWKDELRLILIKVEMKIRPEKEQKIAV